MRKQPELLASYWTISGGLPHTDREYSPYDFRERVKAVGDLYRPMLLQKGRVNLEPFL